MLKNINKVKKRFTEYYAPKAVNLGHKLCLTGKRLPIMNKITLSITLVYAVFIGWNYTNYEAFFKNDFLRRMLGSYCGVILCLFILLLGAILHLMLPPIFNMIFMLWMGNSTLSMLKVFVFGKGEYFTNGFFTIFKKPSSAEHARRMKELYDSWNFQNNIQNMPTWADVRLAHLERLADIKAMEAQQAFDSSVEQVAVLASENTELFTMLGVLAIFAVLVVGFFKNIDIIFGNTP